MDYETLPTVLSRYSFNEKMRVCFYYSKKLMTIPEGILHGDELIGKPLPWELETFLMLAVKTPEWKDDDFCGNHIKKFIKIFNKISFGVIGISPEEAFKNISKIGISPSNKDINAFKDFYLYDGNKIKLFQNSKKLNIKN